MRQFRKEFWIPDISCRAAFGRWMSKGGLDVTQTAKERTRKLLQEHTSPGLSSETMAALTTTVKNFEAGHPD
jgi:trimethylamine:corrinoid methyltransferase-like protein